MAPTGEREISAVSGRPTVGVTTCHALTFCFFSLLSPTERPMFQIEVIDSDSESV